MHGESRDFILPWNLRSDGIDHARVLFEGEFEHVSHCRIVHPYIETFMLCLEKEEESLEGFNRFGGEPDAPITLFVPKMRIEFVGEQIADPHMLRLHLRLGSWRIEIAEIRVVDCL